MGKGWAYLALCIIGALMLWGTGQFDEVSSRSNLNAREAFWNDAFEKELRTGTARMYVEGFLAHEQVAVTCHEDAGATRCTGLDPHAKGGTATSPMGLELEVVYKDSALRSIALSATPLNVIN
ncbi:hypothetical protein [Stenotrophomonas sp.]|uniref:hypothetical protein n=1 Tax=Stenotrophomonas sp. TaxID=69392 RepID=UPI00289D6BDF|nr:hypothetical protein [Stenotrophomonas sp.]